MRDPIYVKQLQRDRTQISGCQGLEKEGEGVTVLHSYLELLPKFPLSFLCLPELLQGLQVCGWHLRWLEGRLLLPERPPPKELGAHASQGPLFTVLPSSALPCPPPSGT